LKAKNLLKPEDKLSTSERYNYQRCLQNRFQRGKQRERRENQELTMMCDKLLLKETVNEHKYRQSSKGQLDTGKLLVPVKDGK